MKKEETPKYRPGQKIEIPTEIGRVSMIVLRYLGSGEYLVSHRLGTRVIEKKIILH